MSIERWEPDTALAGTEVDLATATLDELAALIAEECRQANFHLVSAVGHFIRLGEILNVAHDRITVRQEWDAWVQKTTGLHRLTALRAMRVARYKEHLPPAFFESTPTASFVGGQLTISDALQSLRGLPAIRGPVQLSPEVRAEARRLRATGMKYEDIGLILGISRSAAHRLANPEQAAEINRRGMAAYRRRERERRAAAEALAEKQRREERDQLARTTGGNLAQVYSLIRRAITTADQTGGCTETIRHLHHAEDEIIRALQQARTEH